MNKRITLPVMVNGMPEERSPVVRFTSSAAEKVRQLLLSSQTQENGLRLYIQGGGCSGFEYKFELSQDVESGDVVITTNGVNLYIDPLSLQYLLGAEVDYVQSLVGSQFVVRNPNAKITCSCGSSFAV